MALVPLAEHFKAEGMAPLAGCTAASLAAEVIAHADAWNIPSLARDFPARPLLVVHSDDADTRLQPVHGRTSCLARFSERSFKSAEAVRGF
jgi:hypothetical protein